MTLGSHTEERILVFVAAAAVGTAPVVVVARCTTDSWLLSLPLTPSQMCVPRPCTRSCSGSCTRRAGPYQDRYPTIDAPIEDLTVLDTSGNPTAVGQPDEFVDYMANTVLTQ